MIYKNDLLRICRELMNATQELLDVKTDGWGKVDAVSPVFDRVMKASEHARKRLEREDDPDAA